ncbi:hypothetical protein DYE48_04875 [Halobacillus trueperi]|uniref:Uncharacterized protein n=1 Tax=Halobacillus trueperi TaxID=156205 RepID=A0A3E0JAW4_9BACI|nr:hypothetical protein DYE48_04875 [Halobacillus trueperi]
MGTLLFVVVVSRSLYERGGGEWRDSCGKKVHGETSQDAVRGGSPRSRGKRAILRSPHPLNKILETESSTIGSLCEFNSAYFVALV